MNSNKFELIGGVNFIDVKATDKGNIITKVLLGIYLGKDKDGKGLYESVEITMFNDIAEQFSNEIVKKDNVHFEGRIGINKYKNKDGVEITKPQFIANSYTKVVYDKGGKCFVESGIQSTSPDEINAKGCVAVENDLPWKGK